MNTLLVLAILGPTEFNFKGCESYVERIGNEGSIEVRCVEPDKRDDLLEALERRAGVVFKEMLCAKDNTFIDNGYYSTCKWIWE